MRECVWIYRPGTDNTHFAFTTCRPGFNYLSKVSKSKPYVGVADFYNGYNCPICGNKIRMDYSNIEK